MLLLLLLCSSIISFIWIFSEYGTEQSQFDSEVQLDLEDQLSVEPINFVVICCGQQIVEQLLVTIKSALIFTKSSLHFIIISDVKETIIEKVNMKLLRITKNVLNHSKPQTFSYFQDN
jgi:hypothetical protein